MITALLGVHLVTGLVGVAFGARLGRRALLLAVLGPALTLLWLAVLGPSLLDGDVYSESFAWVPSLGLYVDFRLDGFAALMVLVVSGIGVLVFAYSRSYFAARGEGLGRLIGLLALFAGSMLGLVLADNLLVLFACWELTSVTSYLLIGNDHNKPAARGAALHALLVTGSGGLVMLAGFVAIGQAAGTYTLSEILANPPSGSAVTVGLVLVVVGALTKSAQYPFQSWLPGAMVAPTPVSAYLHSATMVKAGVYLVARFSPAFAETSMWRPLLMAAGIASLIFGGLRALRQHDLKLLLAFGTISQLGFMMVVFAAGTGEAMLAGATMLLAHAIFKASLFMVVGIVDHQTGSRDIETLGRFGPRWRPLVVLTVISAACMAGVPLTFAFIAKEASFTAFAYGPIPGAHVVLALLVAGSALTVAYSARFVWGAFFSERDPEATPAPSETAAPPSWRFLTPVAVLTAATVVFGVFPQVLDRLVDVATLALDPSAHPHGLAIWHGFNLPLLDSVIALAVGGLLFVAREPVGRVLAKGARIPSGGDVYLASLRLLNVTADRVTGIVQSGSLPVYTGVILLVTAVFTGTALIDADAWPSLPPFVEYTAQLPVAMLVLGAATAAAVVRGRPAAAICLGLSGYAMAGLFVVQGAPDVALTQVTIETLTTVLFVLVLRRLPDRFERSGAAAVGRGFRALIGASVAAVVFGFALVASGQVHAPSVSHEMVARAYPDGDGRNVVNVILVDIRGFDTLGEITVLAAAAIGAVALARAGRRPPSATRPGAPRPPAGPPRDGGGSRSRGAEVPAAPQDHAEPPVIDPPRPIHDAGPEVGP